MKRQISTQGIILRRVDFQNSSLIIFCLTSELGRISVVAKGAKRQKSKFLGKLDLFNLVDLRLYKSESSELFTLVDVDVKMHFIQNTDLSKSIYFYAAAEVFLQLHALEDKKFLALLKEFYDAIYQQKFELFLIFIRFCLRLNKYLGIDFQPQLYPAKKTLSKQVDLDPQVKHKRKVFQEDSLSSISDELLQILHKIHPLTNFPKSFVVKKQIKKEFINLFRLHLEKSFHKKFHIRSFDVFSLHACS